MPIGGGLQRGARGVTTIVTASTKGLAADNITLKTPGGLMRSTLCSRSGMMVEHKPSSLATKCVCVWGGGGIGEVVGWYEVSVTSELVRIVLCRRMRACLRRCWWCLLDSELCLHSM